jgi:hypothetical protein
MDDEVTSASLHRSVLIAVNTTLLGIALILIL